MNNQNRKDRLMRRNPQRDFGGREFGPRFDGPFNDHGAGHPRGRRGSRRRGDIRTALLVALLDEPAHGYELIQRIDDRSSGAWRPSAGSVYPTLQLLEDEGLVTSTERDGKRVYTITDEGRAQAQTRVDEAGGAPWARQGRDGEQVGQYREALRDLQLAARQVGMAGSPSQVERAVEILQDTRKRLYLLLGEE
jgi:DNA-binding PadR family transcriptional regulator